MKLERLYTKLYQLRGKYYLGGTRSIGDTKRIVRAIRKTHREIKRRERRVRVVLRGIVCALLIAFCSCTCENDYAGSYNSYHNDRFTYEAYQMPKEHGNTAQRTIYVVTDHDTGRSYIGMYGITLVEIQSE